MLLVIGAQWHDAFALALFRHQADARGNRIARTGQSRRLAVDLRSVPAMARSAPARSRSSSVRPEPTRPAMPSTSPRCRSNETSRTLVADARPRTPSMTSLDSMRAMLLLRQLAADHHRHDGLFRQAFQIDRVDDDTVAHDGGALADAEHLVQLVRDIDDGDAVVGEALDDFGQPFELARASGSMSVRPWRRCWARSSSARAISTICRCATFSAAEWCGRIDRRVDAQQEPPRRGAPARVRRRRGRRASADGRGTCSGRR